MQNPFFSSAGPRFADRDAILALARETAQRIAAHHAHIQKILLFGSFARDDFAVRSDLDLLVIFEHSDKSFRERIADLLRDAPAYPTDIFPFTRSEIDARVASQDPFIVRALREGITLYPAQATS